MAWLPKYFLFEQDVKSQFRHTMTPNKEFVVNAVIETLPEHVFSVGTAETFFRCVAAYDACSDVNEIASVIMGTPVPCVDSRVFPFPDKAIEGRANPQGISCLYVATDELTAISEVRPPQGAFVTLATLSPTRELKLIDCSNQVANTLAPKHQDIWQALDTAYSKPVERTDNVADYAPTQLIAEIIKSRNYDGIAYRSQFPGNGYNIAIFNQRVMKITEKRVWTVKQIAYTAYPLQA